MSFKLWFCWKALWLIQMKAPVCSFIYSCRNLSAFPECLLHINEGSWCNVVTGHFDLAPNPWGGIRSLGPALGELPLPSVSWHWRVHPGRTASYLRAWVETLACGRGILICATLSISQKNINRLKGNQPNLDQGDFSLKSVVPMKLISKFLIMLGIFSTLNESSSRCEKVLRISTIARDCIHGKLTSLYPSSEAMCTKD